MKSPFMILGENTWGWESQFMSLLITLAADKQFRKELMR
jgi:hypothetical protein